MVKPRYCSLTHAAEVFSVPVTYLVSKLRLNRALADDEHVELKVAGRVLGIVPELMDKIEKGEEWFLSGTEVQTLYGLDKAQRDKISGGPIIMEPREVYAAGPFIAWTKLSPSEQRLFMEGRKHGKLQNKPVRRKV